MFGFPGNEPGISIILFIPSILSKNGMFLLFVREFLIVQIIYSYLTVMFIRRIIKSFVEKDRCAAIKYLIREVCKENRN